MASRIRASAWRIELGRSFLSRGCLLTCQKQMADGPLYAGKAVTCTIGGRVLPLGFVYSQAKTPFMGGHVKSQNPCLVLPARLLQVGKALTPMNQVVEPPFFCGPCHLLNSLFPLPSLQIPLKQFVTLGAKNGWDLPQNNGFPSKKRVPTPHQQQGHPQNI